MLLGDSQDIHPWQRSIHSEGYTLTFISLLIINHPDWMTVGLSGILITR